MSVGLFTTEIYANWVRKKELERWVYSPTPKAQGRRD
jgi:hypothetical protein